MGWNWSFLGGYPASTDVAQSFAAHAFIPMQLFGDLVGFHVLHAIWLLTVPAIVWWDLRQDDAEDRAGGRGRRLFYHREHLGHARQERGCEFPRRPVQRRPGVDGQPRRAAGTLVGRPDPGARPRRRALFPCRLLRLRDDLSRVRSGVLPRSAGSAARGCRRRGRTGRRAAGSLGVAALSRVRQLQQRRLRAGRSHQLGRLLAHALLQHRDPGVSAPLVQRLPEPGQRLEPGDSRGRDLRRPDADGLLRVGDADDARLAAAEHRRIRRRLRPDHAHAADDGGAGAGRVHRAGRRQPGAGGVAGGGHRPLRRGRLQTGSARSERARVQSAAHRPPGAASTAWCSSR